MIGADFIWFGRLIIPGFLMINASVFDECLFHSGYACPFLVRYEMGVSFRHCEGCVAQQFFYFEDWCSVYCKPACKCVPQSMKAYDLAPVFYPVVEPEFPC